MYGIIFEYEIYEPERLYFFNKVEEKVIGIENLYNLVVVLVVFIVFVTFFVAFFSN